MPALDAADLIHPAAPLSDLDLELSEPIQVVSARLRLAAIALVAAVAVLGAWVWAGSWPRTQSSPALLHHGSGPVAARSDGAGSVAQVTVSLGQFVSAGQKLAIVADTSGRLQIIAPTAGTVVALPVGPGDAVRVGSAVALIDPRAGSLTATLVLTDPAAVSRLTVGQQVDVPVGGTVRTARIADAAALPSTGAEVVRTLGRTPPGIAADDQVWLVRADFPAGTAGGFGQASATVRLPSVRVYRLLLGGLS